MDEWSKSRRGLFLLFKTGGVTMSKILKMQLEALKASLNGSIIKSAMLSLIEKNIFKAKHGSLV